MNGLSVYVCELHIHHEGSELLGVNSTLGNAEARMKEQVKINKFNGISYTIHETSIDGQNKCTYYLTDDECKRFQKAGFKGNLHWSRQL